MNDIEDLLREALHDVRTEAAPSRLAGPALRRSVRARTVRVRTGGIALVGAAAVTGAVVAPGLVAGNAPRSAQGLGAKAQPSASFTGKPSPAAASSAGTASTDKAIPVQAYVWSPAGSLIDDPTVLATAPKVASTDSDWRAWGGALLDKDTVSVVFAGRALIRGAGPDDPRPLVVVSGRTSAEAPLRLAVLTTIAGGADRDNLSALGVEAMTNVPADGRQAIAVSNGLTLYVAAEAGVDSATYSWLDAKGAHTAAMKVTDGVAVATLPMADLKASPDGRVTGVKALSHGKVVWDAAPVLGR